MLHSAEQPADKEDAIDPFWPKAEVPMLNYRLAAVDPKRTQCLPGVPVLRNWFPCDE